MSQILSILEDGNSRLFLVGDRGPEGKRVFLWQEGALVVLDTDGIELWRIPMDPLADGIIHEGRAHWLECHDERLVLDVLIVLEC